MKKYASILMLFIINMIYSQEPQTPPPYNYEALPAIQSPTTASLGKFGDIPVSLFNGQANINIPITVIKNGSIVVPISLAYDSSGCRPDQHPSWVGLNWNLQAGGVIKRQKNGFIDETSCTSRFYCDEQSVAFNGYFDSHNDLSVSDWNTINFLKNTPGYKDYSPDEFSFSFNNISGSILMNHQGEWIIKSKDNSVIKAEAFVENNYSLALPKGNVNIPRTFTKFILTLSNGTKYIFGESPEAIEFSYSSYPSMIEPWNFYLYAGSIPSIGTAFWNNDITSSAWHLKQIISPKGEVVNFSYSTDFSFQQTSYTQISTEFLENGPIHPYKTFDYNQALKFVTKSSYLTTINSNNGAFCTFTRSLSNDLKSIYKQKNVSRDNLYLTYIHPDEINNPPWHDYKLDEINFKINNEPVKKVSFKYIENEFERLKLQRIQFLSLDNNSIKEEYGVEYNSKLLPQYCSGLDDHWGYYNGKYYYNISMQSAANTTPIQYSDGCNPPLYQNYYESREPDASLMDAEIIKRITYPTGGYTDFIFEPHDYSKVVDYNGVSISLQSLFDDKMAGGLRIKKIKNYSSDSSDPVVKEYFYKNNYIEGGDNSSGILAGIPFYEESGTYSDNLAFSILSSNPLNYLNTSDGNHITYTEIIEKSNNGYIQYNYSNHDNGYMDKQIFAKNNSYTSNNQFKKKISSSLNLERGLMLKSSYFNDRRELVKEEINQFNSDPNRYNNYVRAVEIRKGPFSSILNKIAFPIYTFTPYLEKQIINNYTENKNVISQTVENTYDLKYKQLKSKTTTNSDGVISRVKYKYPFDFVISTPSLSDEAYDIMQLITNNIIDVPIEKTETTEINGIEHITDSEIYLYEGLNLEKILVLERDGELINNNFHGASVQNSSFIYDNKFKEKVHFTKYDSRGNILEFIPRNDGVKTSFVWSYMNSYPVAKIINAGRNEVESTIGLTTLNSLETSFNNANIISITNQLRNTLINSQIVGYTYKPGVGILTETSASNIETKYEYDDYGRLLKVKDNLGHLLKEQKYNYKEIKKLSFSNDEVNFGNVAIGNIYSKQIKLINTGNLPVNINSISASSGISHNLTSVSLSPNESVNFTINFTPTITGIYSGYLNIDSNAELDNNLAVKANINGSKIMSLSGTLNFTSNSNGNNYFPPSTRAFTITNSGTLPLTINDIKKPTHIQVNWESGTIAAGQSKTINVTFTPIVRGGFSGTIKICSDKTKGQDEISYSGSAF